MSTGHCVETVSWWALLGTSLLQHSTSWRGTASVPLLASTSTEASPSSLSRKGCVASLSLAALLALPPSVKRCSRAGLPSSRSLGVVARDGRLSSGGDFHLVATLLRSCFALPMSFSPVLPPTSFTGASNPGNDCASVFSVAYCPSLVHKISD